MRASRASALSLMLAALLLAALLLASAARSLAAQSPDRRWSLGLVAGAETFRGGAHSHDPEVGGDISVHPSTELNVGLSLSRRLRAAELSLDLSALSSWLELTAPSGLVQTRQESLTRYRLMPAVGVRVTSLGPGALLIRVGPTLDIWSIGQDQRTALGAAGRLALRVPAGRLFLESGVGYAMSRSLFDTSDLPLGYETRALRALSLDTALRLAL